MEISIKKNEGVTLTVLMVTVVVMLIIAGVSMSLIGNEQFAKYHLDNQSNYLNDQLEMANGISDSVSGELGSSYNELVSNSDSSVDDSSTLTSAWNGTVNEPKLLDNMTAIYFENDTEKLLNTSSKQSEWDKWYDYSNKNWANAKTDDGSYWVWIPRYAYKITGNMYTSNSGNISIVFVDTKNQNAGVTYSVKYPEVIDGAMQDYVVHPAFGTNIENGGNTKNISGFWVAKYEMSRENSSNGGETWAYANGADTLTKKAGSTSSIRDVSKPGVSSWRNITINNAYKNSYYYDRTADSHMMKNSEWGAVAYLAQSAYGRDGAEIQKNDSTNYITGTGGVLASTTGNESGVYDLNGGALEFVSAYIQNSDGTALRKEYGLSVSELGKSTEYVTVYPHNSTSDSSTNNWTEYKKYDKTRFGDAIVETSLMGSGNYAWNEDESIYPYLESSFILRGGKASYTDQASGIYMFGRTNGNLNNECSYRTVLF